MGYQVQRFPDGTMALSCGPRASRRPLCHYCGLPGRHLCRYPVRRGGRARTCDRRLCDLHALGASAEAEPILYCPPHAHTEERTRTPEEGARP